MWLVSVCFSLVWFAQFRWVGLFGNWFNYLRHPKTEPNKTLVLGGMKTSPFSWFMMAADDGLDPDKLLVVPM